VINPAEQSVWLSTTKVPFLHVWFLTGSLEGSVKLKGVKIGVTAVCLWAPGISLTQQYRHCS
jgi:hypothetical protein